MYAGLELSRLQQELGAGSLPFGEANLFSPTPSPCRTPTGDEEPEQYPCEAMEASMEDVGVDMGSSSPLRHSFSSSGLPSIRYSARMSIFDGQNASMEILHSPNIGMQSASSPSTCVPSTHSGSPSQQGSMESRYSLSTCATGMHRSWTSQRSNCKMSNSQVALRKPCEMDFELLDGPYEESPTCALPPPGQASFCTEPPSPCRNPTQQEEFEQDSRNTMADSDVCMSHRSPLQHSMNSNRSGTLKSFCKNMRQCASMVSGRNSQCTGMTATHSFTSEGSSMDISVSTYGERYSMVQKQYESLPADSHSESQASELVERSRSAFQLMVLSRLALADGEHPGPYML